MNANASQTVDPGRIDISNHAEIRAMDRFRVFERTREYIRGLLADAELKDVDHVADAQAYRVGDVTIVVDADSEVVLTLFKREVADE